MRERICNISLFYMILACVSVSPIDVYAGPNSGRSRADAYNQVSMLSYQQEYMDAMAANNTGVTTASATENLPVAVEDKNLAEAILNNSSTTTMSQLESCAMLIPTGIFKWAIPESGYRKEQTPQCVAVVELREANSKEILATTTVAAGDSIKCNIDSFPESGMTPALSSVELPADRAPTEEDVKQVMNQEQKQNAGLKIAAGALVAGVAGNLLGNKSAGDTKLFGTGKSRLLDTAIGATAGAGIMAASTYSGKIAGDTIKSTAVNAASGMVIGNMMAGASGSDSVLATVKCEIGEGGAKVENDCVQGNISKVGEALEAAKDKFYIINKNKTVKECTTDSGSDYVKCEPYTKGGLLDVKLKKLNSEATVDFDSIFKGDKNDNTSAQKEIERYQADNETPKQFHTVNAYDSPDDPFYKIDSANTTDGGTTMAYAVFPSGSLKKFGGYKVAQWYEIDKQAKYYYRNADGSVGSEIAEDREKIRFTPRSRDASEGGLVDLSNQARLKGTLAGTAAGGALGGFSGYEGAKTEVSERWVAAVTEYKASLSNFVCVTGQRFLSQYNDDAIIPSLQQSNQ